MIHHGDCLDVMAAMELESVDAIVTDPPYGLEFMGKEWDKLRNTWEAEPGRYHNDTNFLARGDRIRYRAGAEAQAFHARWAEAAYRVAKPSAYLLAFGGTRTVHRMTVALEDAGWIIRDMLVWAYASGFPKSKASLKPAWEPIVMARKPGPLRMLAIDETRIPYVDEADVEFTQSRMAAWERKETWEGAAAINVRKPGVTSLQPQPQPQPHADGRWPANIVLTDEVFGDGYSRFFLIPKADRADREPVLGGLPTRVVNITEGHGLGPVNTSKGGDGIRENRPRANVHPTVKPTELMRHLIRLVTPSGGTVLDPFLGSGTTGLACELEGFPWIGIEREAEYVQIAEARLNGTQRGLGLSA